MANREGDNDNSWERGRSSSRLAGALLLAALVALVGWSFKATLQNDKEIPVIKEQVKTNKSEIDKLRGGLYFIE